MNHDAVREALEVYDANKTLINAALALKTLADNNDGYYPGNERWAPIVKALVEGTIAIDMPDPLADLIYEEIKDRREVRVKALEWVDDHQEKRSSSNRTPIGWYEICGVIIDGEVKLVSHLMSGNEHVPNSQYISKLDTLDESKGNNQRDFEERIKQCLKT